MVSRLLAAFRKTVSVRTFTTSALGLATLWFLVIFPVLLTNPPPTRQLTMLMVPRHETFPTDAGQIYMAAVAARYGLWDDLYPNYREGILVEPPRFTPRSPLLTGSSPENPKGEVRDFVRLYHRDHSVLSRALIEKAPEMQEVFDLPVCRYISPPPFALLMLPLAFTDMRTLAFLILPLSSSLALFGMALFSARIYRELLGRPSYAEGAILLALIAFSVVGQTHIPQGNISPWLAFLVPLTAYGWIRRWQVIVGISLILMIVAKSIALNWCPLLLLRDIRWRTLATMAGLTVLLNGVTLALGGLPAYQRFFRDVLPTLDAPGGSGIPGMVYEQFGIYPGALYRVVIVLLCGLIYWGFWRAMSRSSQEKQAPLILAALAGTMAVFCSLNFTVWLPYFPCYLYFPFLGWLLWEISQAQGKWRTAIISGTVTCLVMILCAWMIREANIAIAGKRMVKLHIDFILNPFNGVIGPAFIFVVAFRRLFGAAKTTSQPTLATDAHLSGSN